MIANVKKNLLALENQTILTQGTVGQTISIALSEDWDGLAVTAVLSAGPLKRDVVVSDASITIPWELLAEDHRKLYMGLHGALPDGSIVIRTNIVSLGEILPSLSPSENEPEAPSPARADQIQALAEQAVSLVRALCDAASRGDFNGADGFSPTASIVRDGNTITISITDQNGSSSVSFQESSGESATIAVDSVLSAQSTNPVQNNVITAALNQKADRSDLHELPAGGTAGQFLLKVGSNDYDAAWVSILNASEVAM